MKLTMPTETSSWRAFARAARLAVSLTLGGCGATVSAASAPSGVVVSAPESTASGVGSVAPLATVATVAAPDGEACPRAQALDAAAIGAEVGCLLARYIQLDTSNPPGNERVTARFLASFLEREGIAAQIIESAPGRANLIARVEGARRGQALLWVHHMDVVPATASEWSVPPFAGVIQDGYLYGRGALDNKGSGIAQLVAFALLRRLGIVPPSDVVLLAVADEESGGGQGARWLTEHRPELFADVGGVLNEGGGIMQVAPGRVLYGVEVAQKAPLWLRVTAHGPAGHGAAPEPHPAASVLVRALGRLAEHEFPIEVLPEVEAMFRARAQAMSEPQRSRYQSLRTSLRDARFREQFMKEPHDAAMVRTTLAITMLSGSPKENVISESASAVLDVRLLPGQEPERMRREIEAVLAEPALQVEPILSWSAVPSARDTALFSAIERLAAQRDPAATVTANVIGGFTDCNAFRAKGLVCYGFMPVRFDFAELSRAHGKDERVNVDMLAHAVLDLHALLEQLGRAEPH